MLRTLLICMSLAALGACATAPASNPQDKTAARDPTCLSTGSRIKQPCTEESGRSYSQEDIDRTGRTNAGAALQQLDPTVTVNHH